MVTFSVPSLGGRVRCGSGREGSPGCWPCRKLRLPRPGPPSAAAAPPANFFQTMANTDPGTAGCVPAARLKGGTPVWERAPWRDGPGSSQAAGGGWASGGWVGRTVLDSLQSLFCPSTLSILALALLSTHTRIVKPDWKRPFEALEAWFSRAQGGGQP